MSKLTYEDKINIYQERKQGNTLDSISEKYGVISKAQFPIDITPLSINTLVRFFEEKA